jgi:hypothetical protein
LLASETAFAGVTSDPWGDVDRMPVNLAARCLGGGTLTAALGGQDERWVETEDPC